MKLTVIESGSKIVLCRAAHRHSFVRELINEKYALDSMAACEGNMLVGNTEDDLCLEISSGARIRFEGDCVIALTGALCRAVVSGEQIPAYCAAQVDSGDEMTLEKVGNGLVYLCINGDIECEKTCLEASDSLDIEDAAEDLYNMDLRALNRPEKGEENIIRLLPSVGAPLYGEHALELLYTTEFTISEHTRQSVGFEGISVAKSAEASNLSYLPVGSVLFSEKGTPIIMMHDSESLGSCLPAACVITHDLPALAQLGVGDKVRFSPCTVEAAQKLMTLRRREYIKNYIMLNSDEE